MHQTIFGYIFCIYGTEYDADRTQLKPSSKDYHRYSANDPALDSNHLRQSRNSRTERGSLDDVYRNRFDRNKIENFPSLRRCRSLALTSEQIYNSLEIRNEARTSRRAQLIPRAKLVDRSLRTQRYDSQYLSTEDLIGKSTRTVRKLNQETRLSYATSDHLDNCQDVQNNHYDSLNFQQEKSNDVPALTLPNYYPDSKYESDNTDNVSIVENISSSSFGYKKYLSYDNLSIKNFQEEPESISYDENIILSKNLPLYDSLRCETYEKPRTIRSPSTLTSGEYFSAAIRVKEQEKTKNDDEREIRNDEKSTGRYKNIEINPVYEPTNVTETKEIYESSLNNKTDDVTTRVEIEYDSEENFKTIVRVDSNTSIFGTTDEDTKSKNKEKQHSHNYLKEFLESQKGSKKPLQNFLMKKFPNLPRKKSNEKKTNLSYNNFLSLPDITARRNLKKSYKIDRKLRKCESAIKSTEEDNRFIVNIGTQFDIGENRNIPVDFELKIAKVPKRNKLKSTTHKPEEFLQAVHDLKQTLQCNTNIEEVFTSDAKKIISDEESHPKQMMSDEEINIRKYSIPENKTEKDKSNQELKCKIVDMKKKVEEIKHKFEQQEQYIKKNNSKFKQSTIEKHNNADQDSRAFESLNPNIVEIIQKTDEQVAGPTINNINNEEGAKENKTQEKQHKPVTKSLSITYPEFDHIRYRVVKSNYFQKKIFTKYDKNTQFDGLMQYLQDYSFQEMLIDNNIIIIEPIRTTVVRENTHNKDNGKPVNDVTKSLFKKPTDEDNEKLGLRKHFFYHPIRVNKEVNDDELPNPDTVKQVRKLFENRETFNDSNKAERKNERKISNRVKEYNAASEIVSLNSFEDEPCCEQQYITEDMMENIRKYGTSITYYGGRIVRKQTSHDSLTNAIMEEIKDNEKRNTKYKHVDQSDFYQGLKFKLVKSNSCSSRLELIGTQNPWSKNRKTKNVENRNDKTEKGSSENTKDDKKKTLTKWSFADIARSKQENEKSDTSKYQYHNNFEELSKMANTEDMDFEPFEIA